MIVVYFFIWNQGMILPNALSHSEADKARFVAEKGADTSDCENRFRPCKTISFALTKANKGDKILVATGTYSLDSSESIVYLLSETHPIFGGYNVTNNYQTQSPDKFITTLLGVPNQYTQTLYEKGFHVISDTKGNDSLNVQRVSKGLASIQLMQNAQPASPCVNGSSAGFSCNNLSILGRIPLSALPTNSAKANDIWGHVDLNDMREYAIIGLQRGIAVVDVTNPESPQVVGSISGQSTTWRDIKVLQYFDEKSRRFKAYAYAGADNVSEGLSIIDLSMLPSSIRLVKRNTTDIESHNLYISKVNYTTNSALNGQTPMLHLTGSNNFGGAWRTYLLATPESPQTAYTNNAGLRSDYTHDASSLLIDDARAQTDCQLNSGVSCNLIIDFNESEVKLWEHNNPLQATQISEFSYPNVAYVHSGWWSEDKQYIFVHDELDERRASLNTTLNVFDISNLSQPLLVETWRGPTKAIDHNGFVKGNKYYMSNYERGVTVLDISDPTAISESGFFDTFSASNNPSFSGVWGVYPYLPSGHILASDIQGGLYVLKDETLNASHDAVGFVSTQISVVEGNNLSLELVKQGQGDLTVDYQILHGSTNASDINAIAGTLIWSANDTQSQFIEIDILDDAQDEYDELMIVVLNNPKNGDIVNAKSYAFIKIEGNLANTGQISFEQAEVSVFETQGIASFVINRLGGTEQEIRATVTLESGNAIENEDYQFANGISSITLFWEDGDTTSRTINVEIINDTEFEAIEDFRVNLASSTNGALGVISEVTVLVKDDESNTVPTVFAGADIQVNTRQTVTLNGASALDNESDVVVNWSQTAGAAININNADTLRPSFLAPAAATTISLQITSTDEFGLSASDTINVMVVAAQANNLASDSSGGGLGVILLSLIIAIHIVRAKSTS